MKITNDSIRKIAEAACRLPGPIWVFGAYILYNFATWFGNLLIRLLDRTPDGPTGWTWIDTATQVKLLGYEAFMLFILYGLLRRKRYAIPLVTWVAGIQFIVKIIGMVSVIRNANIFLPQQIGTWITSILPSLLFAALWMGLLLYTERSQELARLFPPEERHVSKWWVALLIVLMIL